ncbi:unnamed protein product, partial [Ixodes hexagonus]
GCPARFPAGAQRASETFFRSNPNATVSDFRDFINRYPISFFASLLSSQLSPRRRGVRCQNRVSLPAQWVTAISLWVVRSARCHLERTLGRVSDNPRLYEDLWQLLYFSPLMGQQADAVLTLSHANSPDPRLQACLELLEDAFSAETVRAATATLQDAVDDLYGTVVHWVWESRQIVRPRLIAWVNTTARGATTEDVDNVIFSTVNSLNHLKTRMLNEIEHDSLGVSMFSWSVQYLEHDRTLVIPQGLLGVLVNASSSVEPVFVPAVGAEILRVLLPRQDGPYPWPRSHHDRLRDIGGCFAKSLNVDGDTALQVAMASAVLVPLFDLYRRKVREETGNGVRLHPRYTNGQLFFVLWALGHCGETGGDVLVNGAAKHSARFQRTFLCRKDQAMKPRGRCSFWR